METLGGFLTVADAAARLGLTQGQLLDLISRGPLVAYADGPEPHVHRKDLAEFMREVGR
jgi:excisionase family DNA binding protein